METLLNNEAIESPSYYKFNSTLLKQIRQQNIKLIDLYSRQEVLENSILYTNDEQDKTASVLFVNDKDMSKDREICIPTLCCDYLSRFF